MLARYMLWLCARQSVRQSVCLSVTHESEFYRNGKSRKQRYPAKGRYFSHAKGLFEISMGSSQTGRQNRLASLKSAIFDKCLAINYVGNGAR